MMGWIHSLSLLALSIICWLTPSLSYKSVCVRGGRKTWTSAEFLHLEGTKGPAAAEA